MILFAHELLGIFALFRYRILNQFQYIEDDNYGGSHYKKDIEVLE